MLEAHLHSPVTRQRLRTGPAAPYIDAFAAWLRQRGYRPIGIDHALRSLAGWTDWLRGAGFTTHDLVQGFEACKVALAKQPRVRHARGPNRESLAAAARFLRFLREHGVIPQPVSPASPAERWPLLGAFRSWMSEHRGLTDASLDVYQGILGDLLVALGDDPCAYTATRLRAFVLARAQPHGIARAKSIVVAGRAFLRFLGATGRCAPGLEHALPAFAGWHLAATPRFLAPAAVDRLLAACPRDPTGLRDRAVLLLLARLGLRASEVAGLTLADLDWRTGRLAVCGKGRRAEWLPLPQAVGAALLRYLRRARPPWPGPTVFATVKAPWRPLTRQAVSAIVVMALRRAGVETPVHGAHVLRHSAATAMLRQGVSLAGIAAVLRHRSPRTTAHYAKVDFALLREIAQAWPGGAGC